MDDRGELGARGLARELRLKAKVLVLHFLFDNHVYWHIMLIEHSIA